MAAVRQMLEYLSIATTMERDVYTCKVLIQQIEDKLHRLKSVNYYSQDNYKEDLIKEAVYYNQKRRLPKAVKIFIILCLLSCLVPIFMFAKEEPEQILLYGVSFGLWAIIIGIILLVRRKSSRDRVNHNSMIYKSRYDKSQKQKQDNDNLIKYYSTQLIEAQKALNTAAKNLNRLYSEQILPQRYHNLIAVSTMYQWLREGRCTAVYGHGGLFDTYETDLRFGQIVSRLDDINEKMDLAIQNQGILIQEVQRGNSIAEKTYKSVCQIENNTEKLIDINNKIQSNTEIIAMNSAYQSRMLAYNTYYRKYY